MEKVELSTVYGEFLSKKKRKENQSQNYNHHMNGGKGKTNNKGYSSGYNLRRSGQR